MDQVAFDFGDGAPPDHSFLRFHCYGLPFTLQYNPRVPNTGKNQGDHFHLSPDDEVPYSNRDRQGERRTKNCKAMLHNGDEDQPRSKAKCPITTTD